MILFYKYIGPNLAKNCSAQWDYTGTTSANSIYDINTNEDEIVKLCEQININKASCIGNLSSEILRDAFLQYLKEYP